MSPSDEFFMQRALELAHQAEAAGEVPVGAVIVLNGEIAGEGFNSPISSIDPTAHAECLALREASKHCGNYRLPGSTLYVTLEPCLMCLGAMVHARVERLVYGAAEPKSGMVESNLKGTELAGLNHRIQLTSGVLADQCRGLVQRFFEARRATSQDV